MTNYEYVILNHEILNDFIWGFADNMCDYCVYQGKKKCNGGCEGAVCLEGTLKWLKEEHHD